MRELEEEEEEEEDETQNLKSVTNFEGCVWHFIFLFSFFLPFSGRP